MGEDKKPGRKTKLTPEVQDTIVEYISQGNYDYIAAQAAGVCKETFYDWIARGEAGEEPFLQFLHSVKKAETAREAITVNKVLAAGDRDWRALATYLERKYPARWGRKDTTNVNLGGQDGKPLVFNIQLKPINDDSDGK